MPGENNHKIPAHLSLQFFELQPLSKEGKQDYHRTLLIKKNPFKMIIVCVHVCTGVYELRAVYVYNRSEDNFQELPQDLTRA